MMEALRGLAVFAAVADAGSFRAAARALSLSPSVVSHHVAELERRVGVPLLHRTTRRLALTPDGERLLPSARAMTAAAEQGLDAVSERAATPVGSLRLSAPAFLADTTLSEELGAFARAHPGVSVRVSFTDAPQDLLKDGLDLALRVGRLAGDSHKARKLAEMRRTLVAAPAYVRGRPAARRPQDLAQWDYVQLSSRAPEVALVGPGRVRPTRVAFRPRLAVDNAAALRRLLLAGAGVSTLPDILVQDDLVAGRLVAVLPRYRLPVLPVHAVWPGHAQRSALVDRFLGFLAVKVAALFS